MPLADTAELAQLSECQGLGRLASTLVPILLVSRLTLFATELQSQRASISKLRGELRKTRLKTMGFLYVNDDEVYNGVARKKGGERLEKHVSVRTSHATGPPVAVYRA
jgi:hypothetical protein